LTGPHESLTRRRALASFGVLAGLAGIGCASSNAATAGVARPKPGTLLWRSQPLVDGEYVLGLVPAGGVVCVGDGFRSLPGSCPGRPHGGPDPGRPGERG
jgi:hypothetical protein